MTQAAPDPQPAHPDKRDLNARMLTAVYGGAVAQVRALLQAGADVDARDAAGRTGLHLAVTAKEYSGYGDKGREMLSLFLNRKLPVDSRDKNGATPLHQAVLDENYSARYKIEDLIKFGADVNARDAAGKTPLHYAVACGNKNDGLKCLLEKDVSINAADHEGATPLHVAAARGDQEVVKLLLQHGANATILTKEGKSVGDYAEAQGHEYLAQVLRAESRRHERLLAERAAAQKRAEDPWTLLAPDRVSLTTVEKKIGYKLTEVFNFNARVYTQIAHNLQTKAEAVSVKSFDEFADKTHLEKAHDALLRLGGTAPRQKIYHAGLEKPRPPQKGLRPKD